LSNNKIICLSCNSDSLELIQEYNSFNKITSDSKPFDSKASLCICNLCGLVQKIVNKDFLDDIKSIYQNYSPYEIAGREEQKSIDGNKNFISRSNILVENLFKHYSPKNETRINVLDIGCSYGNTLSAFNNFFHNVNLFGLDLDNKNELLLRKINNFKKLFNKYEDVDMSFDIVTLIHTFEHIIDPVEYLVKLKQMLNPNGLICIQIPDLVNNPFDLLITDHVCHFDTDTLTDLVALADMEIVYISNQLINKEISVILKPNSFQKELKTSNQGTNKKNIISNHFEWLNKLLDLTKFLRREEKSFGIYGTSNASIWLTSSLDIMPDFFVDDDINRQGKLFNSKMVFSRDNIPKNSCVLLPFNKNIVNVILSNTDIESKNYKFRYII